jgi:hypothetical protein
VTDGTDEDVFLSGQLAGGDGLEAGVGANFMWSNVESIGDLPGLSMCAGGSGMILAGGSLEVCWDGNGGVGVFVGPNAGAGAAGWVGGSGGFLLFEWLGGLLCGGGENRRIDADPYDGTSSQQYFPPSGGPQGIFFSPGNPG